MKIELKLPSKHRRKNFIQRPWFFRNTNHCIFWKDNPNGSKRFLECVHDNFWIQMIKETTKKGSLLDLILVNKAEVVMAVKGEGRLGCTDHEVMQFRILSRGSRTKSRTQP